MGVMKHGWIDIVERAAMPLVCLVAVAATPTVWAQTPSAPATALATDTNTPLHLLRPDYPVPYGPPTVEGVATVLQRVRGYLEAETPARLVSRRSGQTLTDYTRLDDDAVLAPGAFRLISYEWAVTYSGMLLAAETTGDARFRDYVAERLRLVGRLAPAYRSLLAKQPGLRTPLSSVLEPRALDDAGSMCAAMIKAQRAGIDADLRPLVDNYIAYISTKELRLADGTLARNRPQPNTIWLDDLYMSVPALAQMGQLTGERRYFDDAVKQVLQFAERMFIREKGLFMHGWVQGKEVHPEFHWARANGWALLTLVELLDVLPADHAGRPAVLDLLRRHVRGLAARQSGSGFWHQLLDREDSYLETSATAIYAYGFAHAIDRGWIDPVAYGPAALLAWNAAATKVNALGQVEGTCVGTGMGFDPAFYYHRPTSPFAAHGYGPVLLAGAEVLRMLKQQRFEANDSSTQLYR
jgi:unsaturated rhamnogalacturonyl hydrolase